MIPPKRFDISPPLTGRCSEGLDAFRFLFKLAQSKTSMLKLLVVCFEDNLVTERRRGEYFTKTVLASDLQNRYQVIFRAKSSDQ